MLTNDQILNILNDRWEENDPSSDDFYINYKCMEAINFRTPKPPFPGNKMWQCPTCLRSLTRKDCIRRQYEYCPECGQNIDWRGVEEEVSEAPTLKQWIFTGRFSNEAMDKR